MLPKAERKAVQFLDRGIQTTRPTNRLEPGKFVMLQNVRAYQDGIIMTRPGQSQMTASAIADTPIHSIERLNDDAPSASQAAAMIVGAGTKLYTSNSAFSVLTLKDSGYSGNYLSMVPHRPTQSAEPWMYVADSQRMRKVKVDGTNYPIGIAPPNVAPSAQIGPPVRTTISDFEAAGAWANAGDAGAIAVASRLTGATTITRILFDSGTTGLASVQPSVMDDNVQPGMFLIVDAGGAPETFVVEQVFRAIVSTTIAAITFDSGTIGACTIQLTASSEGLERDALIRLNAGGGTDEAVKIQSVTVGPDGIPSIRVTTANTHAAAETVDGLPSFRAYFTANHVATNTLTTNKFRSTITFATGVGTLSLVGAVSLATSSNRPISDNDEIHISLRVDDPSRLLEARIMFDVDANTNDFTRNYLYKSITQNALTQALQNTITTTTATARIAQQQQLADYYRRVQAARLHVFSRNPDNLDAPDPFDLTNLPLPPFGSGSGSDTPAGQTTAGNSQWTELVFKVGDLIRVGADTSRTLKNVAAIRLQFQISATIVVDVDAWWIGGTYGADVGDAGSPYLYCYTARSKATGATSNPSPPMRSGIEPHRQRVTGTATQHTDSQVDVLDIYRIGGSLNEWRYVMTIANGATPTFTDDYPDDVMTGNPLLEFNNYQPFPSTDIPRSGTCNVSGTKVTRTGGTDSFNTSWARNSVIKINGITYTLYASPTSATVLETNENVGNLSGATFEVPDAVLLGQPLPVMWGPYGGGLGGVFMFACGDPRLPGTLFVTKGNNPDAAFYRLEITSGSEELVAGCIYDGRCYVFSTKRMYSVEPVNGGQDWVAREVANSVGLQSRWGLCVGDHIYFVGASGVYRSDGGQPISLSQDSIGTAFLEDATPPSTLEEVSAFNRIFLSLNYRLDFANGYLFLDYNYSGTYNTLVYDTKRDTWGSDVYSSSRIATHYGANLQPGNQSLFTIMGGVDGRLYKLNSAVSLDHLTSFICAVYTAFEDANDSRIDKVFQEAYIDAEPRTDLTISAYNNNTYFSFTDTFTMSAGSTRTSKICDLNAGAGRLQRSIGLLISWSHGGANDPPVRLFEYHFSFYPKTERTSLRFTDWTDGGYLGDKRVIGFVVRADTFNVQKTFTVQYDGGSIAVPGTFNITHNGEKSESFAFSTPFIAKLLRVTSADADQWNLYDVEFQFDKYPENLGLIPDFDSDGDINNKWLMGFELEADTANLPVTLQLQGDGGVALQTYTVTHNGRIVIPYDLDTPAITHAMRLVPTVGTLRDFKVKWDWVPYPENWATTPPFDNDGDPRAKWLQGFELEVDTLNLPVTFQLQADGAVIQTYTVTQNGKGTVPFSVDAPPIIHEMRLVPTSGTWRYFKVRWIHTIEPELADEYIAAPSSLAIAKWGQFSKDGFKVFGPTAYITHRSTADLTLTITVDGVDKVYTVPNSGGNMKENRIVLGVIKGKIFQSKIQSSAPFRLYDRDCSFELKPWGYPQEYLPIRPFTATLRPATQGEGAEI